MKFFIGVFVVIGFCLVPFGLNNKELWNKDPWPLVVSVLLYIAGIVGLFFLRKALKKEEENNPKG